MNGHIKLKVGVELLTALVLNSIHLKCIRLGEDEGGETGARSFGEAVAATVVANSIFRCSHPF